MHLYARLARDLFPANIYKQAPPRICPNRVQRKPEIASQLSRENASYQDSQPQG